MTRRPRTALTVAAVVVVLAVAGVLGWRWYQDQQRRDDYAKAMAVKLRLCIAKAVTASDTNRCLAIYNRDLQLLDR